MTATPIIAGPPPAQVASARPRWRLSLVLLVALGLALGLGGHALVLEIEAFFGLDRGGEGMLGHPAILALLVAYVLLLAIPFVPGAELGMALILLFGADIAWIVYLATVLGLCLSFWIGRSVSPDRLGPALARLGAPRLAALVGTPPDLGLPCSRLVRHIPERWLRGVSRHRMVTLMLLFNLPGNTMIGGGGGIALLTGLCGLLPARRFLLAVSLGVAPVPLAVTLGAWMLP